MNTPRLLICSLLQISVSGDMLYMCTCRLIHGPQFIMAHKTLIIAQTPFDGVHQGGVRRNSSLLNFSPVLKTWDCTFLWVFCLFGFIGFWWGFFFKLVIEEPKPLRKCFYFLAVITTFLSWKRTKIWLHTKDKRKAGSLDNHSFLFIEHRNCFSTKLNLNAAIFQPSYPQHY